MGVSVENQTLADARIPYLLKVPAQVRFLSVEPLIGPVRLKLDGIDWVIVGCESGPRRRSMNIWWARSIANQCREARSAFWMKQIEIGGTVTEDFTKFPPDLRIREFPSMIAENEIATALELDRQIGLANNLFKG